MFNGHLCVALRQIARRTAMRNVPLRTSRLALQKGSMIIIAWLNMLARGCWAPGRQRALVAQNLVGMSPSCHILVASSP